MESNQLLEFLKSLSLSDNEAKVYLASLSLGPSSILRISQAAEIKRTTVYSVVESLQYKGLISIQISGSKKIFAAENPEKLHNIVESRSNQLKDLLPEFAALYNLKGGESFIKYYQGLENVKIIYENLIKDVKPHEDYSIISDHETWYRLDPEYFQDFIERRAKLNINLRLLLQDSPTTRRHKKFEKNFNEKVKILPANTALTTNLVIIPRRVVIHQLTPPVLAIVIENKSVIQMHKEMFEIMWQSLPEQSSPNTASGR